MTTKYYALLTNQGAAKFANAAALGTKLQITEMAVGDGGGTLPAPDASRTALIGEKRRASLNSLSVDAANSSQIIAEQVIPENEGGFWIREIGLFDADGDMVAVANCPETYKPQLQEGSGRTQTVRMILIVNSTAAVTLKIDPAVVLATRKYVDDEIIEVKAYADSLMAAHIKATDPHEQYVLKTSPNFKGRLLNIQKFISSGTYTPTTGTKTVVVEVQGGGGAGGGSAATSSGNISLGSGGAEGCYGKSIFTELNETYQIAVGAGGKGVVGSSGGAGGTSAFGNLLIADGGYGGGRMAEGVSVSVVGLDGLSLPSPPKVTGANLQSSGYAGTFIFATRLNNAYAAGAVTGMGGRSIYGAGGGSGTANGLGGAATAYGAGGGGAKSWVAGGSDTAYAGGNGASGVVIIWEYS